MKKSNNYNGLSAYQNKKRVQKQQGKLNNITSNALAAYDERVCYPSFSDLNKKPILIMLDLQGTLDGLCDRTALKFLSLLSSLKKKLNASDILISFSTHDSDPIVIKYCADILKRNSIIVPISFAKSFYLNGTYNVDEQKSTYIEEQLKLSKLDNFNRYIKQEFDSDLAWVGIFDDSAQDNEIYKYKNEIPMALFRPSQTKDDCSKYDNLMCHSAKTYGIEGVIEMLSDYILMLDKIKVKDLLQTQQKALFKLHSTDVLPLCQNDPDLLIRYIKETELEETDYKLIKSYFQIIKDNNMSDEILKLVAEKEICKNMNS